MRVCLMDLFLRSKKQLPTRFLFEQSNKQWKNTGLNSSKECYSIRVNFQKVMNDNKGGQRDEHLSGERNFALNGGEVKTFTFP